MHFDWSTFALQTVNFAILVWLLHRFLYRPVLRLVDERRAAIDKQYADARAVEAAAKAQRDAVAAERDGITAERAAVLRNAAAQAEQAAAARRAQAERDATALIDAGRKMLAAEREAALTEAQRTALDLGAAIATRLMGEMPAKLRAESWMERIEQHLAALPATERDSLAHQLAGGASLTVVTASALPSETQAAWRERLRDTLGDGAVIRFAVDAALVAGAELHFPHAVLRFSWAHALDAMRGEVTADADPR